MTNEYEAARRAHPSYRGDDAETTMWDAGDVAGRPYAEDDYGYVSPQPRQQQSRPETPTRTTLSDRYDISGLATEFAIVAAVAAVVMALVAAVADLVLVMVSGWLGDSYTASDAWGYVIIGALFAVAIAVSVAVFLLLDYKVNEPGQVWGWLAVGIPSLLIAVVVLTTISAGASLYPAAFLSVLVVGAAVFIGSLVPGRVAARRVAERSEVAGA